MIDTIRGLLTGADTSSWPVALAWCAGIAVVFAAAAGLAFARRVRP